MRFQNRGFGALQFVLVFAIIGFAALFAVPEYKSYLSKAKLTEAFRLASESKRRLSEFYMLNGRFPQSESETSMMKVQTVSPPEFVQDMEVRAAENDREIMIRVYLKEGVAENPLGEVQFIYVAGNGGSGGNYGVQWTCGAEGLDPELLPEECKS